MKNLIIILSVLSISVLTRAQNPEVQRKIHERKKDFLAERMSLEGDTKTEFFALYEEFELKRKDLRIDLSQNRMGLRKSTLSEKEAKQIIEKELAIKQKVVDLENEYVQKYFEILEPSQVVEMFKAEEEFRELMMNRMRSRQGRSGEKGPGRPGSR